MIEVKRLPREGWEKLIPVRSQFEYEEVNQTVRTILENVRTQKDEAIKEYNLRFDHANTPNLEVSKEEIQAAYERIPSELREVLVKAERNIRRFHEKQIANDFVIEEEDGSLIGQRVMPIEKVGLYVPGGTASYPSTVLMNAVPAKIAGVKELVLVSPPGKNGEIADPILAAAYVAGVDRVFRVGGAQAVAALCYGTESIPKVYKIVGPGNIYVAMAKKMVFGQVAIDMIAGPSEVMVVADETANPAWVAADLLSQAEHDKLAMAILVTDSEALAEAVKGELEKQTPLLPRCEIAEASLRNYGRILVTESLDQAFEVANEIAPEHLELAVENPLDLVSKVRNAGSVFLGHFTTEPLGDYLAGPNHTLPTSGTAKFASPLSVDDFRKKTQICYFTKEKELSVARDVALFARSEGLEAHARAALVRLSEEET
ncbi:MAG: histidinol dehydrogenase [Firmicutes bacterium]|nr:histidinol dehydrogenase [Bacillota bacterium]